MAQVDVKWPSDDDQDSDSKPISVGATPPTDEPTTINDAIAAPEAEVAPQINTEAVMPVADSVAPVAEQNTVNPTVTQPEATTTVDTAKAPKNKKSGKNVIRAVLEVLLVLAVAGLGLWSWTLYTDNQNLQKQVDQLKENPQAEAQKQADAIVARVSALRTLPTNEVPTVANVTDAAAAKKQSAFFVNAQNGDKVLVYVKNGQAILFRPSTNKVILAAPLNLTNTAPAATSSTTTAPKTTNTQN